MPWFRCQKGLMLALLLCGITGAVDAQRGDGASHLQPQHRAAVKRWLESSKLALRVATVADCSNKEGLAITRGEKGKGYHPYYAVGDFNGDRRQDFAIALINPNKRKDRFSIAIFNGLVTRQSVPAYFTNNWDVADGGLFEGAAGVIVGPFESDNCVILRPRGKKYVIKDC